MLLYLPCRVVLGRFLANLREIEKALPCVPRVQCICQQIFVVFRADESEKKVFFRQILLQNNKEIHVLQKITWGSSLSLKAGDKHVQRPDHRCTCKETHVCILKKSSMENGISIQSNKYIVDIIQPGGVLHLAYCLGHSCSIYIDFS